MTCYDALSNINLPNRANHITVKSCCFSLWAQQAAAVWLECVKQTKMCVGRANGCEAEGSASTGQVHLLQSVSLSPGWILKSISELSPEHQSALQRSAFKREVIWSEIKAAAGATADEEKTLSVSSLRCRNKRLPWHLSASLTVHNSSRHLAGGLGTWKVNRRN